MAAPDFRNTYPGCNSKSVNHVRTRAVAFVLKGYPRLSEAFIAQEIRALEERGLDIRLFSLRHPTGRHTHPIHREIKAPVVYLPEYLYREPTRLWRAWRAARRQPGYGAARRVWVRDLLRDPTPNRVRRFGQALVLVRELPSEVGHLHAHFLHTPASVTRYAALLTGLPWSCSAHAKDIWTIPDWEKREKLTDCQWAVTCTATNFDHLRQLVNAPKRVELLYHGLDFARFPAPTSKRPSRDGSAAGQPAVILSVGRAVEKKGYDDLLDALAALPPALNWRFVHVGAGPLLTRLKARAQAHGIAQRLSWLGAQPHDEVLRQYVMADVFVLACRVARDGDRDGLPNVLMEAQSQGLACLSTGVSAIPELIEDGVTGLLTAPRDAVAFSVALARLIADPEMRERLGDAGKRRVKERFSFDTGIDRLATSFRLALQETHP
jgi:glycosyltransferase involved in cell wall biosynthesis